MFFGATAWVFRWNPPYDGAIDAIANLGFKGIELPIWNNEFMKYFTQQTNKDLRQQIEDRGMQLTSVFCCPEGAASKEPKERVAAVEEFRRAADISKQLGAGQLAMCAPCPFEIMPPREMQRPTTQTWTVNIPKGLDFEQNYNDFIDSVHKFADACEEFDTRLAFEPHPHRYMKNADSMLRILEYVPSDRIGMNLDPSHLFPMGEMAHIVVYRLKSRIFHVHFSDNDGQTNAHWRPGKGKVDWNSTIRALKETGYNHVLSIELEDVLGAAGSPSMPIEPIDRNPDCQIDLLGREYKLTEQFIRQVCEEEGVEII